MAFTSSWVWDSVSRNIDENIIQDTGVRQTRNNWSLTRSRYSDEDAETQLGENTASLSAYRGSTLAIEDVGELSGLTFDATQNWTDTSYIYLPDRSFSWVGSGGVPRYAFELDSADTNKPDNTKTTIVKPVLTAGATEWEWKWQAGEWAVDSTDWQTTYEKGLVFESSEADAPAPTSITITSEDATEQRYNMHWSSNTGPSGGNYYRGWTLVGSVSGTIVDDQITTGYAGNGIFISDVDIIDASPATIGASKFFTVADEPSDTTPANRIETASASGGSNPDPTDAPSPDGLTFSSASGTFSGSADAAWAGSLSGGLYCTNDTKTPETDGTDWYKQTQNWTFLDEYV